jgi:hypothetical protein
MLMKSVKLIATNTTVRMMNKMTSGRVRRGLMEYSCSRVTMKKLIKTTSKMKSMYITARIAAIDLNIKS